MYLALENNLKLIPVVNKIDLPNADRARTAEEMKTAFGFTDDEIVYASGKTGEGVEEILRAVVSRVPAPRGNADAPFRGLIFDSTYDVHRGVIAFVRCFDGALKKNQAIRMISTNTEAQALEVGYSTQSLTRSQRSSTTKSATS